jgi:hypothetical protein
LTQVLSHCVGRFPEQDTWQPVGEQSGMPAEHVMVQEPQCSGLVMSVSHPSSAAVVQWA